MAKGIIADVAVVAIWLCSIVAVVQRDIVPLWTAEQAPSPLPAATDRKSLKVQFALEDQAGRQIGQSWVEFTQGSYGVIARSTTLIRLPGFPWQALIETDVQYDIHRKLSDLKLAVYGLPWKVRFEAASYGQDFACQATVGERRYEFVIPEAAISGFTEAIRPFTYLHNLRVGQTWRIADVNLLSPLWGQTIDPQVLIAKVVAKETVKFGSRQVQCYRVETRRMTAWVSKDGRVLLQRITLPVVGTITIRMLDEFDDQKLLEARRAVRRW